MFGVSSSISSAGTRVGSLLAGTGGGVGRCRRLLRGFDGSSSGASGLVRGTGRTSASLKSMTASKTGTLSDTSSIVGAAHSSTKSFSSTLSGSLSSKRLLLNRTDDFTSAKLARLTATTKGVGASIDSTLNCTGSIGRLGTSVLGGVRRLTGGFPKAVKSRVGTRVSTLRARGRSGRRLVGDLRAKGGKVGSTVSAAATARRRLASLAGRDVGGLRAFHSAFSRGVLPLLNRALSAFSALANRMRKVLGKMPTASGRVGSVLSRLRDKLSGAATLLSDAGRSLDTMDSGLGAVRASLGTLANSTACRGLLSLRNVSTRSVSSFVSSPIRVGARACCTMSGCNSSVAPFCSGLTV